MLDVQLQRVASESASLRASRSVATRPRQVEKSVETRRPFGAGVGPGLVSMWMPTGPGAWDDWSPVRLDVVPVTTVGELLVFQRKGTRFGVPGGLLWDCSDSVRSGHPGWIAIPAWYARSLALDDAVWV